MAVLDMLPGEQQSLYEIGFMVAGGKSIYAVALMVWINSSGCVIAYFVVLGNTLKSIMTELFFEPDSTNFFATKYCYVILVAVILVPLIIKKEMKELKIASFVLFIGLVIFLGILCG